MKYEFEDVRDSLDPVLRKKIDSGQPLTPEEILAVKVACDLGDTCGCDDDHHSREYLENEGSKRANYAE